MFEMVNSRKVNFKPGELQEIQNTINALNTDVFVRDFQVVKK